MHILRLCPERFHAVVVYSHRYCLQQGFIVQSVWLITCVKVKAESINEKMVLRSEEVNYTHGAVKLPEIGFLVSRVLYVLFLQC